MIANPKACCDEMGKDIEAAPAAAHSCSSSIDSSSSHPSPPFFISNSNSVASSSDLSTDLKLGLSISSTLCRLESWRPIKPQFAAAEREDHQNQLDGHGSLFVKVYMEGIPIGRKLDLFAHHGYNALITTLRHMFRTTILFLCPDHHHQCVHSCEKHKHFRVHVLTYEDKEGDWMMAGDVPWEMFLTTVKRLKIIRADRC